MRIAPKVLIILFCAFLFGCDFKTNNLKFDSEKWKTADLRTKGRMSRDLRDSNLLIGKTKSEVENLLGKPKFDGENWTYTIDVGDRFGTHVWTHNLILLFDKNTNTVQRVYDSD